MSEEKEELKNDQQQDPQEGTSDTVDATMEENKEEAPKELTAEEKYAELNDRYLRLHAEFDNFRKRTYKERIELTATANKDVLLNLLPVMDNFERAIVTNEIQLGIKAKHLTTTAKVPHPYEYVHDEIGYNFRMPNLNAALACAQLEQLNLFIQNKRNLASEYSIFFESIGVKFRTELPNTKANYWLMCIELENTKDRDSFLKETNEKKVMTRPIWQLIFKSPLYSNFQRDSQENAIYLENRIVNIPSSVRK